MDFTPLSDVKKAFDPFWLVPGFVLPYTMDMSKFRHIATPALSKLMNSVPTEQSHVLKRIIDILPSLDRPTASLYSEIQSQYIIASLCYHLQQYFRLKDFSDLVTACSYFEYSACSSSRDECIKIFIEAKRILATENSSLTSPPDMAQSFPDNTNPAEISLPVSTPASPTPPTQDNTEAMDFSQSQDDSIHDAHNNFPSRDLAQIYFDTRASISEAMENFPPDLTHILPYFEESIPKKISLDSLPPVDHHKTIELCALIEHFLRSPTFENLDIAINCLSSLRPGHKIEIKNLRKLAIKIKDKLLQNSKESMPSLKRRKTSPSETNLTSSLAQPLESKNPFSPLALDSTQDDEHQTDEALALDSSPANVQFMDDSPVNDNPVSEVDTSKMNDQADQKAPADEVTEVDTSKYNPTENTVPIFIRYSKEFPLHRKLICDGIRKKLPMKLIRDDVKIVPESEEHFNIIKKIIAENHIPSYAYNKVNERPVKLVVKGLPSSTCRETIKDEFSSLGFQVHSITQLRNFKEQRLLPIFLVIFHPADQSRDLSEIYDVDLLDGMFVTIENFHSRSRRQCYNCQRFGHHSDNCRLQTRCLICSGSHRAQDCTRPREEPATCANCSGPHPANFSKCPECPEMKKSKSDKDSSPSYIDQPSDSNQAQPNPAPLLLPRPVALNILNNSNAPRSYASAVKSSLSNNPDPTCSASRASDSTSCLPSISPDAVGPDSLREFFHIIQEIKNLFAEFNFSEIIRVFNDAKSRLEQCSTPFEKMFLLLQTFMDNSSTILKSKSHQ